MQRFFGTLALCDIQRKLHADAAPILPGNGLIGNVKPAPGYGVIVLPHHWLAWLAIRIKQQRIGTEITGTVGLGIDDTPAGLADHITHELPKVAIDKQYLVSIDISDVDRCLRAVEHVQKPLVDQREVVTRVT